MFGYININGSGLSEENKNAYQAYYCGLCRQLKADCGTKGQMLLSYDLTFLIVLLTGLYELDNKEMEFVCPLHPTKRRIAYMNEATEYAADMTIALTYYKCLDDWNDDKSLSAWLVAKYLKKKYEKVKELWPAQCATIEMELKVIAEAEKNPAASADEAANSFGRLMAGLFTYRKDLWQEHLQRLGYGLGRFIYFADATIDYKRDVKKGSYNPLVVLEMKPENLQPSLKLLLGDASQALEFLPLVQDAHLLRNILYSGIWMRYDYAMRKKRKKKDD